MALNSFLSIFRYVWNKQQFDRVTANNTDHLLGLFEPSGMKYEHLRSGDRAGEPSLSEMTAKVNNIDLLIFFLNSAIFPCF